ncbi:glycosyltransferase family 4 protein [Haloarculaceae archaeon H-GB2-1]|nr:glycosyltransferase family 4 protein [Haloarculaceae archaeon H-GB11]MEA5406537.1 glycosyltransferase family 4 protein [Haloarculaceae archaeon H-GB2-1]
MFDLDDAVFLNQPLATRQFIREADVVITGNTFLKDYAEHYADTVYRVPTGVPDEPYLSQTYDTEGNGEHFTLGWVGNAVAHRENLLSFADVADEIATEIPNLAVHLVGVAGADEVKDRYQDLDVPAEFTDWIPSHEYARKIPGIISTFDVGVMPLTDSFWNRGKSAMKLLEYMACGVPPITNPVGENAHIIDSGENGFLVNDREEWIATIQKLQDSSVRADISVSARETVKDEYTMSSVVERLRDIFRTEFTTYPE